MTRRVLKPQPEFRGGAGAYYDAEEWGWDDDDGCPVSVLDIAPNGYRCGDRLWVREAAYFAPDAIAFAVDNPPLAPGEMVQGFGRRRSAIHMPRWASRLTLSVTDARVQRVQDISEADAIAEGCPCRTPEELAGMDARGWFRDLWDSLNTKRGYDWDANPWVAAVTFSVQQRNIDAAEAA